MIETDRTYLQIICLIIITTMKLYLDVCCLNRPFDEQTQDRIYLESAAVITILRHVEAGEWEWINSSVVLYEVNRIPNLERRHRILKLCNHSSTTIKLNQDIYVLSESLTKLGFKSYDALHLACAKQAQVDVFLSTDDKLLKNANRQKNQFPLKIDNPLHWLQEIT